jgi:hypothetical protein
VGAVAVAASGEEGPGRWRSGGRQRRDRQMKKGSSFSDLHERPSCGDAYRSSVHELTKAQPEN